MKTPLTDPTRFLLFTGKGGVGKTSAASATGVALAAAGKRVLIVSTDPASNLDAVLGIWLSNRPTPVPGAKGLDALNIDPEEAARGYRERVIAPYRNVLAPDAVAGIEEQLSGACTVEIAAFDEFANLIAPDGEGGVYDHVIFDTAPTGHTLRLLALPEAWSSFLQSNSFSASCLGPHSGLKTQQTRYEAALDALTDAERTTVILVTRPEHGAIVEAERTLAELAHQGLTHVMLLINGVFRATRQDDPMARALEARGQAELDRLPETLAALPRLEVPLQGRNMVGLEALRWFFDRLSSVPGPAVPVTSPRVALPRLLDLVKDLEGQKRGLVMVMGKGGVGKTTVAAALAIALADRGVPVHLTTTDPAAHVAMTVGKSVPNLRLSRIDPHAETAAYSKHVIERSRSKLDAAGLALLEEDLRSPCTEEVAVFHAFSRIVFGARNELVVMDTAPTGHTLLLLDATGSYHREMLHKFGGKGLTTPLMHLQDPQYTRVLLVTLAETTPVLQAEALQRDLERSHIRPYAWIINASLAAAGSIDPVLLQRIELEQEQIAKVRSGLAERLFVVPWVSEEPVGTERLRDLIAGTAPEPQAADGLHTSTPNRS